MGTLECHVEILHLRGTYMIFVCCSPQGRGRLLAMAWVFVNFILILMIFAGIVE